MSEFVEVLLDPDVLEQFRKNTSVKTLRVLRAEPLKKQFGPSSETPEAVEQRALQDGRRYAGREQVAGGLVYRSVAPVVGSKSFFGKNCLTCHDVADGTVLGAVAIQIGLERFAQANRDFRRNVLVAAVALTALLVVLSYLLCTRP